MDQKEEDFYNNEVFAQAEVVPHPKDQNRSALILTQSFHLLSDEDVPLKETSTEGEQ
ncbi:transcriptional regulator SplA domain-containing protein [uncultured Metabacillus sp.]|uniref:transcriptional regulator SplA domain-containing protein n=1 Tax=uncultured Metabacillus sp. TaxID=2860135 RepID=UPI002630A4CB|nr:transcriptional regulator SplA domain-containing protein [uncultured Metabacillus sp.]